MECSQTSLLETLSEHLKSGRLADDIFMSIIKAQHNRNPNTEVLDSAIDYVNLIKEGYSILIEDSQIIDINNSKKLKAFQNYKKFARQKGIANIPLSISQMEYELNLAKRGNLTDKSELDHTKSFFTYLLRDSVEKFDEASGYY
ncbi:hypothetical protein CMI46_02935 [Candidatus Pacearchaeota archaeon]|nr:hypothetical protein [Candidatus Pacearchaeota archaeon]|tara:strand:- start:1888 stop:2319 length:432 start_codon:yes stop_codon:yes gene_type:complete